MHKCIDYFKCVLQQTCSTKITLIYDCKPVPYSNTYINWKPIEEEINENHRKGRALVVAVCLQLYRLYMLTAYTIIYSQLAVVPSPWSINLSNGDLGQVQFVERD